MQIHTKICKTLMMVFFKHLTSGKNKWSHKKKLDEKIKFKIKFLCCHPRYFHCYPRYFHCYPRYFHCYPKYFHCHPKARIRLLGRSRLNSGGGDWKFTGILRHPPTGSHIHTLAKAEFSRILNLDRHLSSYNYLQYFTFSSLALKH